MNVSDRTEKEQKKVFLAEVTKLWPVAKGSLAKVRKPCIRSGCSLCAAGKKHPAFIFSFKEKGQRRCMYVAPELAPMLRKALRNGRLLEYRMNRMGADLIRRFRRERIRGAAPRARKRKTQTAKR